MTEPWYSIKEFVVSMGAYLLAFAATLGFVATIDFLTSLFG